MTAYIWDLDGTLLDSYGVIVKAAVRAAADAGIQDSEETALRIAKQESLGAYLRDISVRSGVSFEDLRRKYREYTHETDDRITLTGGAKETLERLHRAGAAHFVFTHRGQSSEPILQRLGILHYFGEIVTSEYRFSLKPSGEGVRYLVEKYGLDPAETWYVGDRTMDVLCAKDAGVKALFFQPADSCVPATRMEDRIVRDLREI